MSNNALPDEWTTLPLGEIVQISRGVTFPASEKSLHSQENFVLCLRTSNVQDEVDLGDVYYIPEAYVKRPDQWVQPGDILMSLSNSLELVGKVAVVRDVPERTTVGAFLGILRSDRVDQRYVFYGLRSPAIRRALYDSASRTVNIANLSIKRMGEIAFPVAPLDQQRRIVAKLEALLSHSRQAKDALDRIPALVERYRKSLLAAACSGKLTEEWRKKNPDVEPAEMLLERIRGERRRRWEDETLTEFRARGRVPKDGGWREKYQDPTPINVIGLPALPAGWCYASIESLTHLVTSGSRGWGQYYSGEGPLFLRVGDLNRGTVELDLRSVQRVQPPVGAEGERTRAEAGDVLISITADVGMIGLVPSDLGPAYVSQHVALTRPSSFLNSRALAYLMLNPHGIQRSVQDAQYGMTKKQLSLPQIRGLVVPLPPRQEQDELVRVVEEVLGKIALLGAAVSEQSRRLCTLEQSALFKAFQGRLCH